MAPLQFTANQRKQLNKTPKSAQAHMKKMFADQNYTGTAQKRPTRSRKVSMAPMNNMPAPDGKSWNMRGTDRMMPDVGKGNWSQTPAASGYLAPRGFGYYDAYEHDPFTAATHMSIGPATPIVGSTNASTTIQTKASMVLTGSGSGSGLEGGSFVVIVYPSTSDTQARLYNCSSDLASDDVFYRSFTSPQLSSESPLDAIPTRCSARIRNTTQVVAQGGLVRVLRMTSGIGIIGDSGGSPAQNTGFTTNGGLAEFMDGVRNHARTRTYTGSELGEAMQKNCTVADQSRALWFEKWNESKPAELIPWALARGISPSLSISSFTQQVYQPAYTPIVFLFEPFLAQYGATSVTTGLGNYYELGIRSQFLAHYPQGTMLANLAINPRSNPSEMTKHRDFEETKASALERVAQAIGHAGHWGWDHREQIAAVAKPFIQRIFMAGG